MARQKGARAARKASKGKGKRWLKGHSSSSNPETTKFREAAKTRFFQVDLGGSSNLTTEAVQKHNAVQYETAPESQPTSDVVDLEDVESCGGAKTFDTFASNWTACSNPSFEKFLQKWQPNTATNKDRLAVLAAVAEIIKSHGGKETETEYFAALMTTLAELDNAELLTACVTLIGIIMKRMSQSVLKLKFSESSKIFLELLAKYSDVEYPSLVKGLIGCLSLLLRLQEPSSWSSSSTMRMYEIILSFTTYQKPRVRKAAQHAVCSILKGSELMLSINAPHSHPAAHVTAKFCIQQLEEHGGIGGSATTLHILGLMKHILAVFPQQSLKVSCETILRLMTVGNVLVTSCCLEAFHGMFITRPKVTSLPTELNAQLITALHDFQPSVNDPQPLLAWLTVLKAAHVNLLRLDENLCLGHLARFFYTASRCWLSMKVKVWPFITSTLKGLLYESAEILTPVIESMMLSCALQEITSFHKMFQSIENCLSYQYHSVWNHVLHVLAVFFELFGKMCHSVMKNCLKTLSGLRKTANFPYVNELDYTIGKAVRGMGPKVVLENIKLDFDEENCNFEQSWLIPILRDNVQEAELGFFHSFFLPLISKISHNAQKCRSDGRIALSKSHELLHDQIWSLLPGFCTSPTDLKQSFKGMAKTLGTILSEHSNLRLDILASLRALIFKNINNDENRKEIARFAKNFLPILFNLYTTPQTSNTFCGEGVRLAVYDTITAYLKITSNELCSSLFDKAVEKLASSTDMFLKHAVMDIIRTMLPKVDRERCEEVYQFCLPLLNDGNRTIQKKAYRIFEELCLGQTESTQLFLENSLNDLKENFLNSLSSTIPSSKAPRLRCLQHIVHQLTDKDRDFIISLIPEVVLCAKESAVKVRIASSSLLIAIGEKLLMSGGSSHHEIMRDYIKILLAGFAGTPLMIASATISLTHIVCHFKDKISDDLLQTVLESIAILLVSKTREVVGSALDFIKAVIGSFRDIELATHLALFSRALDSMTEDCKSYFRMKIRRIFQRLIRKFGYEVIRKHTPEHYLKLLTYIRKQEARNKRKQLTKEIREFSDEESSLTVNVKPQTIEELLDDSESESENGKEETKIRKARNVAWIQEEPEKEIVDLLDPKASGCILASRPDKAPARSKDKDEFKVAPDGRLIIVEEDETKKSDVQLLTECLKEASHLKTGNTKGQKRKHDESEDSDTGTNDKAPRKYQVGGSGIHRPIKHGDRKQRSNDYGSEYKAKNARGDVKRKGKPDPYAYIQLNTQVLNKRKKAKFAGQFKSIIRGARKGGHIGRKAKARKKSTKVR